MSQFVFTCDMTLGSVGNFDRITRYPYDPTLRQHCHLFLWPVWLYRISGTFHVNYKTLSVPASSYKVSLFFQSEPNMRTDLSEDSKFSSTKIHTVAAGLFSAVKQKDGRTWRN